MWERSRTGLCPRYPQDWFLLKALGNWFWPLWLPMFLSSKESSVNPISEPCFPLQLSKQVAQLSSVSWTLWAFFFTVGHQPQVHSAMYGTIRLFLILIASKSSKLQRFSPLAEVLSFSSGPGIDCSRVGHFSLYFKSDFSLTQFFQQSICLLGSPY